MYTAQTYNSQSLCKHGLVALFVISLVMLFPDMAFALDETGDEVTTSILDNLVKYGKWIAFAIIGFAFMMVGYFCLRAYGAWADEDNNKGTMPRLVLTVFFGIMILAIVTIFVTKGAKYLEDNVTNATTSIVPIAETVIA